MKIAVSGATGLVGTALTPELESAGHTVIPMVRSGGGSGAIAWSPKTGEIDAKALEGVDAVIHLAGENIAGGRWTEERKAAIRNSRVNGTSLIARTLAGLANPPKVLISASAIGYFGDRGDQVLTEESPPGDGFLADVCREWEASTAPAEEKGIRVAHLRFGIILSRKGGALAKMLLPFQLGAGGNLGNGRQYMSWITLADITGALRFVLDTDAVSGPVNTVAPAAVTNAEFTKTLGRVLGRPTIVPLPAFAARLLLGEMADALLLASTRVRPGVLEAAGYAFLHPGLEEGLRFELSR